MGYRQGRRFSHRTDTTWAEHRAVRLAAILDHGHPESRAGRHDGIEIRGLAVEMHGDDGPDRWQAAGRTAKHIGELSRVHRVVGRVDVDQ